MIPKDFADECGIVRTVLSVTPSTAAGEQIERERKAAILVNREIQKQQIRGTNIVTAEASPSIQSGVIGQVASMAKGFPVPEIMMLQVYPKRLDGGLKRLSYHQKKIDPKAIPEPGTPQVPQIGVKNWQEKCLNYVDRFFLWVNSFFK